MKVYTLLFLVVAVAFVSAYDYQAGFTDWMKQYNKVYSHAEFQPRFGIWKQNQDFIMAHNKENQSFKVAMNQFGDLTAQEFASIVNGLTSRSFEVPAVPSVVSVVDLPASVDWRTKGAVTPIKNQGQCGSCWTFSSTGGIEGQWFLKHNQLVSLSEQQIVDCCTQGYGCSGGWMDWAFSYIQTAGSEREDAYPYTAVKGTCRYNSGAVAARIGGHVDVAAGSESALQAAVANIGPISVAIDASHSSFQFYSSGVYYAPACSTQALDHAVLAVGYGTESGSDYWLVKNSWGTSWGSQGYIYMSRNRNNNCGIATHASYPISA
jgi:cathepsin L